MHYILYLAGILELCQEFLILVPITIWGLLKVEDHV